MSQQELTTTAVEEQAAPEQTKKVSFLTKLLSRLGVKKSDGEGSSFWKKIQEWKPKKSEPATPAATAASATAAAPDSDAAPTAATAAAGAPAETTKSDEQQKEAN
ncbi:hypothetical protein CANCADRAFT_43610 [Tortispora caseinolytica NRRL Y-17796]|uniref:Uncharacterized protein n=1 Tax=Tortispora caseinolytica NRRL Y-17796 TaxID=767744 RepID=A0A1E4TDU3_9ASCO|nr:hypothetical protein CANCADRAFT_43610 [Tortispora caseinolytica NRRL Y-17796]